jgi:nicotinamide phosphoribosyltransferase
MSLALNPALACDFYKVGHKFQYPEGTEMIYSNFTPRSAKLFKSENFKGEVTNFGLQGFARWFLIDHWNNYFFNQPKQTVVEEYSRVVNTALGMEVPTDHIEALHDLGYLPIQIKSLPEGAGVPIKVPVFTIKNTDKRFFWLVNYIETVLSSDNWKTITNATIAFEYRVLLEKWAEATGSPKDFVLWQGHDFSARGMSGIFDATASGAAHLTSFLGTDTIPSINYLEAYYGGQKTFVGGSVPATEHSVMCAGGQESEIETFRRILKTYPTGVISIVSDTWDFWNVITTMATELKPEILARQPNAIGLAKTVFRPDSGDPVEILCGIEIQEAESIEDAEEILKVSDEWEEGEDYGPDELSGVFRIDGKVIEVTVAPWWNRHDKRFYYIDGWQKTKSKEVTLTPEQKGAVECLWDIFGGTVTNKGFKVLDSHVGLIYGDSITLERADQIMSRLAAKGFASCNVVFGIGSYTYQYNTRDTFGMAMKATYAIVNGEGRELFKDPKTDSGTKKSAKGLLRVELEDGKYVLYDQQTPEQEAQGELKTIFCDGKMFNQRSIMSIRDLINARVAKQV